MTTAGNADVGDDQRPRRCRSAGGSTSGSFGAPSVTVIVGVDRRAGDVGGHRPTARSAGRPRPPDRRRALMSATMVSGRPVSGPASPVPKSASTMTIGAEDVRPVQLPGRGVGDLDDVRARLAEDPEVDAGVAPDLGGGARPGRRRRRRRADAGPGRRRSRRRRCCRVPHSTATRQRGQVRRSAALDAPPPPGGRRSP